MLSVGSKTEDAFSIGLFIATYVLNISYVDNHFKIRFCSTYYAALILL